MGNALRDIPGHFSYSDTPRFVSDALAAADGFFVKCPVQPGLWLCCGSISAGKAADIAAFASAVCGGFGAAGKTATRSAICWPWYLYDPARCMAPVLLTSPNPSLRNFEVFGCVEPEDWLRLGHFYRHPDAAVCRGALSLLCLASRMRTLMRSSSEISGQEMSHCSFLQLQGLYGAEIQLHIDAPSPPADVIGTVGVVGSAWIRVGAVETQIDEGDVYLLAGAA